MEQEPEANTVTLSALSGLKDMPPLIASISHALFVLFCCQVSRRLANTFIGDRLIRAAVEEFICTVQLCVTNFELGVVTEVYGFSGYAVGLFVTSISYCLTFENGTADPSECLWNLCKRQISPTEFLLRSVFSVAGAAISYRAAKVFWSLDLVPEHGMAWEGAQLCTASLQVSLMLGLLFEAGETFVNRLIQNTEGYNMLTGGLTDVAITFFGLFVTGGYFNPSLSLAMELGCSGLAYQDFFIIYFGGPFLATLIAVQVAPYLLPLIQPISDAAEEQVAQSENKIHSD
ncbi:hypothetical protein BV898_03213 [Hypsibius exemplaris]|uniref:Aquaporin n=1 Tax=Hypsibius exemplaris TaxID=2072580 RepID=A0A1W0X5G7_HYPEX|nr:hypothetical protein BV898_03213 [Hypsibius exemplaris]